MHMKSFKFLAVSAKLLTQSSFIKFKDARNRDKYMNCIWSQFPKDGDDTRIKTYVGNILGFYNDMQRDYPDNVPTIYEIYKQYRGEGNSIVLVNHTAHRFIKRKYRTLIYYTI